MTSSETENYKFCTLLRRIYIYLSTGNWGKRSQFGNSLTSNRRTDVADAVNSDEVDEEDVLLGSALERALSQLNNANVEAADDGHSSLIVDENTAEQSDNQIKSRLRPKRGRSKIAGT
ncbi:Chorismate synthase [Trichinella pseudospiralis]